MTTDPGEAEIVVLRGALARTEAPSVSSSGSRSPSALRGGVTTKTSPGFVRFQIRTARAPRPRLGQNPRKLPLTWLVVRVVKSQRIGGQPRQRLVQHLGSIRRDDIHLPGARRRFWAGADARLAGFSPEIRHRFEDAIATRIPRPPAEEPGLSLAQKIGAARARMQAFKAASAPQDSN
jgi:hypothetical protein